MPRFRGYPIDTSLIPADSIQSFQIASLSISKLTAGTLDAGSVNVESELVLSGAVGRIATSDTGHRVELEAASFDRIWFYLDEVGHNPGQVVHGHGGAAGPFLNLISPSAPAAGSANILIIGESPTGTLSRVRISYNLQVVAAAYFFDGGEFPAGVFAPGVSFDQDHGSGMFRTAAGPSVSIAVSTVERLRVTAAGQVLIPAGSAAVPGLGFLTPGPGLFRGDSDLIATTNGTDAGVRFGVASGPRGVIFGPGSGERIDLDALSGDPAALGLVRIVAGGSTGVVLTKTTASLPSANTATTAAAANVNVTTGGLLRRSTSSRRYKRNVEPYRPLGAPVLALRPVWFEGSDGTPRLTKTGKVMHRADRPVLDLVFRSGPKRIGLIAEDVAEVMPAAVVFDEFGRPDALDWPAITTALIAEVQALRADLDTLAAKLVDYVGGGGGV